MDKTIIIIIGDYFDYLTRSLEIMNTYFNIKNKNKIYGEYENLQDRNFDQYSEAREQVWDHYQGEIEEAQQQEENDNDYSY